MQPSSAVLGQLFFLVCMASMLGIAAILFILFGPVPQKKSVVIVPRLGGHVPVAPVAQPSLVAQLAPARDQFFTPPQPLQPAPQTSFEPLPAAAAPVPTLTPPKPPKPKAAKVQPAPRKRIAKGTDSPFAPVVRARPVQREDDLQTNPVPLFEAEVATLANDTYEELSTTPRRNYEHDIATTPRRSYEHDIATTPRGSFKRRMFETEAATIQRHGGFDSGEHTVVDD